ncbi:MAG TPA: tRNA 2-thiouridine(34) synthase MnmA [Spirochaetes bacterium]|nr:tRNA 2-thiouridine(34) synthase MnmA [Spirochaetota bacterium]
MRIAVAMSGGLDSTVAALLLKDRGHEIVGLTALLHDGPDGGYPPDTLHDPVAGARAMAARLGIEHYELDLRKRFGRDVVDPFCEEYSRGRTPSPCIRCNAFIKFGALADRARELGCDLLATGHYARVGRVGEGRYFISRGADRGKDQSYFLFMLTQEALAMVAFPLGGLTKESVRVMAAGRGLPARERPESQEICFVPDNDYPGFIEKQAAPSPPPGDIVDPDGKVIGRHRGIHRYTIGQRRGLGIAAPRPLYVAEIDPLMNRIIAAPVDALYKTGLIARDISFMKAASLHKLRVWAQIRSTQEPFAAVLSEEEGALAARFEKPQKGVSPGQAAVFYDAAGDVLGGGWIERGF